MQTKKIALTAIAVVALGSAMFGLGYMLRPQGVQTPWMPTSTSTGQVPVKIVPTSTADATSTMPTPVAGCHALTVLTPTAKTSVDVPIHLRTIVDNRVKGCHWTVFEAQAGGVELKDASGTVLVQQPLKATADWMTDEPVDYTATLMPKKGYLGPATIVITEENPSDRPNPQTVVIPVTIVGSDF